MLLRGGLAGVTGATQLTAGEAIAVADVLALDTSGKAVLASATYASGRSSVFGVSLQAASGAELFVAQTNHGRLVPLRFSAAPASANNGKPVWLDTTSGRGTLTPSNASGVVRFFLGYLQGADGAETAPDVLFSPQQVSRIP
jgi:hypothetical protein